MNKKYFGTDGIRGTVNSKEILQERNFLNLVWLPPHILKILEKINKLL